MSVRYITFLDVYPVNEPIGVALADDIKDSLTNAHLTLRDYSTVPPAPTASWIEFEHVLVEQIPTAATSLDKRSWRAVKATAVCFF